MPKCTIQKNNTVGRFYTAACDLKPGEVVFSEEPFSVGPKSGAALLCLACYRPLEEISLCDKCSWPICSPECSKDDIHTKNECELFKSVGIKFNKDGDPAAQIECITPLRTLFEARRNPKRWKEEVLIMESHTSERESKTEFWKAEQTNVVNFLHDRCKIGDSFDKQTIQKVCGILEVNCYEIIVDSGYAIRGLYPKLAILSHNCIANTTHSKIPDNKFTMILRTTESVKQGEELFSSYTRSTDPTLIRRMKLLDSKFFHCQCKRCSDPTELGTHLNTLKCTKCDNGLVLTNNPLDNDASWKCTHCDYAITSAGVQKVYDVVQNQLDEVALMPFGPERIESLEKLLKQYKSFLHPRHAFKLAIWQDLIQLYGRAQGYSLDMLPDLILERKTEMCQNLLKAYDVIEPGYTRLRGLTLYELHVTQLLLSRSQYEYKVINTDKFKEEMRKVVDILIECGTILSLEPEGTAEYNIGMSALQASEQLKASIELVQDRVEEENEEAKEVNVENEDN